MFPFLLYEKDAVRRSGLPREKIIPENPQIFRNPNIRNMFSYDMAQRTRSHFESYL